MIFHHSYFFCLLACHFLLPQVLPAQSIEQEGKTHTTRYDSVYFLEQENRIRKKYNDPQGDRAHYLFHQLPADMQALLSIPTSWEYDFKILKAVFSDDSLLRSYSWDCNPMGNGFRYGANIIQYKHKGHLGTMLIREDSLPPANSRNVALLKALYRLPGDQYLAIAWSSSGLGMQQLYVYVLAFEGNTLQFCDDCMDGNSYLHINLPRMSNYEGQRVLEAPADDPFAVLGTYRFEREQWVFSYPEYKGQGPMFMDGFTGQKIKYQLVEGTFRKMAEWSWKLS